jgi:formylglycine-generating enzyme required for sulfatase activity
MVAVAVVTALPAHSEAPKPNPNGVPGEKYALLVAVHKYAKTSELRELHYPERDMDDLARVLRAGGYRPENVVLLTQTAGADDSRFLPTSDHIRKELTALLRDREQADSVLVAFAGHGVQFRGSDESYFCPADARPDDKATLLPLNEVYQALAKCPARFKLLLSDACRNDPISAVSRRASVNLESKTRPQVLRPPGGVAALFSCSEGEIAFENDGLKHGVFFHFVIEGLGGAADFDKDGQIILEELSGYAKRRVLDFVRAEYDGVRQMPVLKGEFGGLPVLVNLKRTDVPARALDLSRNRPAVPSGAPKEVMKKADVPNRTTDAAKSRPAVPSGVAKEVTNSVGMKLVLIPAGEFDMGAPDSEKDAQDDEKPRHRVRITRPFYLGATEVTQGEYRAVTGQSPSSHKGSDDLPVEQVSWLDAVNYCNALSRKEGLPPFYRVDGQTVEVIDWNGRGYRLPTEAEWEYACRAGNPARYSFGDDASGLGEYAWYDDNSGNKTHPVGQKRANTFGLYDMHGNVWEWCWDGYSEKYDARSPVDDPRGPLGGAHRVIRGGSWSNYGRNCRSAYRYRVDPGIRSSHLGFRAARVSIER